MNCEPDPVECIQASEPEISLRAVNGIWSPDTVRVLAQINKELIILLLDTWRTHNFPSKHVVRTLKIPCENHSVVKRIVAIGQSMMSRGFCK